MYVSPVPPFAGVATLNTDLEKSKTVGWPRRPVVKAFAKRIEMQIHNMIGCV